MLRIIAVSILVMSRLILSQELVWTHTGGPMGGIVEGLAINSKGDIYAGVIPFSFGYTGLYKSTNNGNTWNKIFTQYEDFQVLTIFISKDDVIWVGTDFQGAIFRSTDNGITWENKANGYGAFGCWAFGESKEGVLFAGDVDSGRLYRSTDNGENWQLSAHLAPLSFAADSENTVYMGTFNNGLYKSNDNGISWTQVNSFVYSNAIPSIIVDENNNIYCGTGFYNYGDGVYYSSDRGESWVQLGLSGKTIFSLVLDSNGNLYAGTVKDGLFKTSDLGQHWEQKQKGIYRKEIYRITINQNNDIFLASEGGGEGYLVFGGGGVFRSTDGGNSFKHVGLPISLVKNMAFSGNTVIITSTPSGVQKYDRVTSEWNNIGLHNVEAISLTPSNIIYAATRDDGLYKTTDFGIHWLLTTLTADTLMPVYNVMAVNDDTVFASTFYGLRKTTDGGDSWSVLPINTGDFDRMLFYDGQKLWVTGSNSGLRGLYKSSNLGLSFEFSFSDFYTNDFINLVYPVDNYVFLASLGDNQKGIARSTDYGQNWNYVFNNKRTASVFADENGLVLTSSLVESNYDTNFVLLSTNFGVTWSFLEQPTKFGDFLTDIKKDRMGNFFFGTYAEGLYQVDIITDVSDEKILNYNYFLSQNYPNPFNPSTKIEYSIKESGHVKLKVYDILGREVEVLVNEYKSAGNYTVEFNAQNLPSGIYFYTLTAGKFSATRKLILMK